MRKTNSSAAKTTRTNIVGEVCLYGTSTIGAGWLATTPDGKRFGDGEPRLGRSFTEAVWLAAEAIRSAGVKQGLIRIFAAGGERMADADVTHVPYFGSLKWEAATSILIHVG